MHDHSESATSPSLIRQVQAEDSEAWERLSQIYSPLVYGWVRRSGLQEADAVDVVQNVFTQVARSIGSFTHVKFRGWLLTITKNEIRLWFRKRERELALAAGGSDAMMRMNGTPDFNESAVDTLEESESEAQAVVRRAAETIKDDYQPHTWQAFWRSTVEGHNGVAIAEDLGMTPKAVRQAKFRVLTRLREMLSEDSL